MEAYFVSGGLPMEYRCDVAVNWTFDRWLQRGEPQLALGIGTLIFGIVSIALYIPCCIVLLQRDIRAVSAYKMLFIVSICQVVSLVVSSVFAGIFFIQGIVFCNYPNLNYWVGSVAMTAWGCVCITCLTLSFSRLVDLWSPALHDSLFAGKRIMFSFTLFFLYAVMFFLYARPLVFNSRELAWIFDPLVYPDASHFMDYSCLVTIVNNEGTVGLTLLLTLLFVASFAFKSTRYQFHMSSSQKQLFIQSSFSSFSSLTTASIYVSFQFISAGRWYSYLGLLTWQIASDGELLLFLFINKTIRNRVLVLLRMRRPTVASITGPNSTRHSGMTSNKSQASAH